MYERTHVIRPVVGETSLESDDSVVLQSSHHSHL